jgi:DNA-directed RNA polymerase alpha subunit
MKTILIILLFCVISFVFGGVIIELSETVELNNKIAFYMNEGYSPEASEHLAKVELNIIPVDAEYMELIED